MVLLMKSLCINQYSVIDIQQKILVMAKMTVDTDKEVRDNAVQAMVGVLYMCTDEQLMRMIYVFTFLATKKGVSLKFLRAINKADNIPDDFAEDPKTKALLASDAIASLQEEKRTVIGVSGLVSLMLVLNYDTEEWMNKVIGIIMKFKKFNETLKELIQTFVSRYGKTHLKTSNFSRVELDNEILELMKTGAKKLTYFA